MVRCQVNQRAKALEDSGNHCRSSGDLDKQDHSAVTEQYLNITSWLPIYLWSMDGCLISRLNVGTSKENPPSRRHLVSSILCLLIIKTLASGTE